MTAREELKAKVRAMPLGMLMQAVNELSEKLDRQRANGETRDEAEVMVKIELTCEHSRRVREQMKDAATPAVLAEFQRLNGLDYPTMPETARNLYWVLDDVLRDRFPAATEAADAWLDTLPPEGTEGEEGQYGRKLLELIHANA